jgi:DNA-binding response OmpR family regulator
MSGQPLVMVVDNDLGMCGFLRGFLVARGSRPVTVTSGDDALRRFRTERAAAVLLDVVMPGMDGLAVPASLRRIDREVPVIVMSGQGRTNGLDKASQASRRSPSR